MQLTDNLFPLCFYNHPCALRVFKVLPVFRRESAHRKWLSGVFSPFPNPIIPHLEALLIGFALRLATPKSGDIRGIGKTGRFAFVPAGCGGEVLIEQRLRFQLAEGGFIIRSWNPVLGGAQDRLNLFPLFSCGHFSNPRLRSFM